MISNENKGTVFPVVNLYYLNGLWQGVYSNVCILGRQSGRCIERHTNQAAGFDNKLSSVFHNMI